MAGERICRSATRRTTSALLFDHPRARAREAGVSAAGRSPSSAWAPAIRAGSPRRRQALAEATDSSATAPISIVSRQPGPRRHASDNRVELERARFALDLADAGNRVAVVSGGDPGVFAMAAAVFEALDGDRPGARPICVEPGVTAMLAAAARLGAPLGGDFCALSLSDNLKPWAVIERRLDAAADADFVIALYNPTRPPGRGSSARPWRSPPRRAPGDAGRFRARGRTGRTRRITGDAARRGWRGAADMATLVLIGASTTRLSPRPANRLTSIRPALRGAAVSLHPRQRRVHALDCRRAGFLAVARTMMTGSPASAPRRSFRM